MKDYKPVLHSPIMKGLIAVSVMGVLLLVVLIAEIITGRPTIITNLLICLNTTVIMVLCAVCAVRLRIELKEIKELIKDARKNNR